MEKDEYFAFDIISKGTNLRQKVLVIGGTRFMGSTCKTISSHWEMMYILQPEEEKRMHFGIDVNRIVMDVSK